MKNVALVSVLLLLCSVMVAQKGTTRRGDPGGSGFTLVSSYPSLTAAIAATGGKRKTALLLDSVTTLAANTTVTDNIQIVATPAGIIRAKNHTLRFAAGSSVSAGPYQIFSGFEPGDVLFDGFGIANRVLVEWFGARGDNCMSGAVNSAAIAAAIGSLPSAHAIPTLVFQSGARYKVSGDPAIDFNRPMIVEGNGAILDYGTGNNTIVNVGSASGFSKFQIKDLIISANSGCSGTAIRYKNVTYFREDNVVVSECAYARVFYSSGGSTGYATIVNPTASNYKYGFHFDAANNASSSVNDIKVFGGNMTIDGAPAIGSRNIYVGATNTFHPIDGIAFFGTQIQPPATVKVEVAGGTASFYNVYWDMSNGGTDILLRAPSKNCVFLGGVNLGGQVISDSGMTSAFYDPNKVRATAGGVLIAPRTIDISNKTSGQIKFPKSPNISSDSNTLDDYGEGTWKGAFVADGGSITVNNTYCMGRYTKIGRSVNITGEFRVNSVSSPTGDLYLTGLPYTNGDDFSNVAAVTVWVSGLDPAATGKVQGIISRRARMISFDLIGSGSAGAMAKYMRAGSTIVLTGTYFVD